VPIKLVVPFPEDRGGGSATCTTRFLEFQEERQARLWGGVEIRYQDVVLTAAEAEIDIPTKTVIATGDVVVDQGPRRLTGDQLTFDLETKTGTLQRASASLAPGYYMKGAEIAKVGEDVYTLTDGIFTSCEGDVPPWSFKLSKARVRVDGYARVKHASMRIKNVPLLYTPYLLWPVKEERTSGFLVPQPGYSQRRGPSLSLAYYQVLGRSYDTTFELDLYGEGAVALGNEFRYRPSEGTRGTVEAFVIDDPDAPPAGSLGADRDLRWKVRWDHETRDLPGGLRGVVDFEDFSDFDFFREFERDFDQTSLRFLDSRGYLSGNWGPHSLNVLVNQRETFIEGQDTVTLAKLPEVEYRLRPTKLGRSPLYLRLDSSFDYLSLDRGQGFAADYLRANLFPQLTLPIRTVPWFSLSVSAGQRVTFYGDSLLTPQELSELPPEEQDRFRDQELTRSLPTVSAEVVGPSFSRIFGGSSGTKLKHVVEPRFTYAFEDEFDDQDRVPIFDEIDGLTSNNLGRVTLVNRWLAKPAGDSGGAAREVLAFELSQAFSFNEDQPLQQGQVTEEVDGVPQTRRLTRSAGPVTSLLRYNPSDRLSLRTQVSYNTLFSEVESTQLSGTVRAGSNALDLTWFTRRSPVLGETVSNQVRVGGRVGIVPRKLALEGQINYDLERSLLQQQRYILDFTGSCYGLRFEVRDFTSGPGPDALRDTDFRFSLTLKNVGTFLDLTGGFSNRAGL
jgi:LPS-assembly protein